MPNNQDRIGFNASLHAVATGLRRLRAENASAKTPEMSALFDSIASNRARINEPAYVEELWVRFGAERTVVVMDMAGFTALSREKGILHYLALILDMRDLTRPLVERRNGTVVKYEADNLFAVFEQPSDALVFVDDAFEACASFNRGKENSARIKICAGLDHGEILLDEDDFFGDAVNLASKLGEDMARTGEVLVSQEIANRVADEAHRFEEIGSHGFFGMALPVYLLSRCSET